ncbi:hypothetical protein [Paenibacillus sp. GP183]|uniref:hypothetical protein n=1 Tax=Paenibacillus sp. GP183 TaxID=1882751 RepID=UPI00089CA604|nr:hypothetical protein [Paenibacillus sp. GP183]SEC01570.1 hypothetical protein SAMN05443246_2673 [Paenibacillus sp. GP183]
MFNKIIRHIPGFRTNKLWKKITAIIIYLFMFLFVVGGLSVHNDYTSSGHDDSIKLSENIVYILFLIIIPYSIFASWRSVKKIKPLNHLKLLVRIGASLLGLLVYFIVFGIITSAIHKQYTPEYLAISQKIYEENQKKQAADKAQMDAVKLAKKLEEEKKKQEEAATAAAKEEDKKAAEKQAKEAELAKQQELKAKQEEEKKAKEENQQQVAAAKKAEEEKKQQEATAKKAEEEKQQQEKKALAVSEENAKNKDNSKESGGALSRILSLGEKVDKRTVDKAKSEVRDQIRNVTDRNNKYVLGVKNGKNSSYPDVTYEQAFQNFFGSPTWKYFRSTTGANVVEFSGYCTYADVEVKAVLQFIISDDEQTFQIGALSFNEVPQNELIKGLLLKKVFESPMR